MKKIYLLHFILSSFSIFSFFCSNSQNVTVNPGGGSYATLSAACSAIASGTHSGNVTVTIVNNTTEPGTSSLFFPNTVTSVLVRPSGNRTVTGNISGSPLLDINSTANVTIDGLNTGGNSLTITNTSTASTAQTSTVMVRNDAKNVTIRNCTILGSSTVTSHTIGGTLFIGNTLFNLGATGNDNLVIENNKFGAAGTNFPAKAIHCNGYASSQPTFQERIRFSGNKIYDFFNASGLSHGMLIQVGKSVWTIRDNHFYQTSAKVHTVHAATQTVLEANAGGTGTALIENNIIGYASANKSGRYEILSPGITSRWYGIRAVGANNTVRGNTITEISISGALSGSGQTNPFSAIFMGDAPKVFKNTIGSETKPDAITLTNTQLGQPWIYGIWANANAGILKIDSNTIAGIKIVDATNSIVRLIGVFARTAGADTNYIRHNKIGTAQAPLENPALGSFSRIVGIQSEQANCIVEKNRVENLIAETGNIGSTTGNPLTGIEVAQTNGTVANSSMVMQGNTISHLRLNHPNTTGWIKGIDFQGPYGGNHRISGNFIHNLLIPNSSSPNASIAGIFTNHSISTSIKGTTVTDNNMIALGTGLAANSVRVFGIWEGTNGNLFKHYYNTIFIGGSVESGSSTMTIGIRTQNTDRTLQNNIIVIQRTNTGGTGKHYAVSLSGVATGINPPGLQSNHNILQANVPNGFIALYGIIDCATLANWQTASGQDANSLSTDPMLTAPTSPLPNLHLSPNGTSPGEDKGVAVAGITIDFDGDTRSANSPDIGADEKVNPLPISWSQFQVTPKGPFNELHWTTLTETNNQGFEIERAEDGVQFKKVGYVGSKTSNGNSNHLLEYQFSDPSGNADRIWYRIKQVDKDGKYSYSKIVMVGKEAAAQVRMEVWPNPALDKIQIKIEGTEGKVAEIQLINNSGQLVWKRSMNSSNLTISVEALPRGIYTLMVGIDGKITSQQRFIKQ